MRNQVNPGFIVPFYRLEGEGVHHSHPGAWTYANSQSLITVGLWEDGQPVSANTLKIINANTGEAYDIGGVLIRESNEGRLYYFRQESALGYTLPCGDYFLKWNFQDGQRIYYSGILRVIDVCDYGQPGLRYNGFDGTNHSFSTVDTGTSPVSNLIAFLKADGNTNGTSTTNTILSSGDFIMGSSRLLRRRAEYGCGAITVYYRFTRTPAGGDFEFFKQEFETKPELKGIFTLDFGHSTDVYPLPYSEISQRFYFKGSLAVPTPEDSSEFLDNGDGLEFLEQMIVKDQVIVNVPDVPDSAIFPLKNIEGLDTVSITDTVTDASLDLGRRTIAFTTGTGQYMNIGTLTAVRAIQVVRSYNEDMGLVAP